MAKCVACTALNAAVESTRHQNPYTLAVADVLAKRWNDTSKRDNKNRYCPVHSELGNGRPTLKEVKSLCARVENSVGSWKRI